MPRNKKQKLEKGYKIVNFTINKDNINVFQIMENRRQVSSGHVSKIHGALLAGKNPVGILIVNKKNNKLSLIDGNHRIEAVKRFFSYKKVFSGVEIDCVLKVYSNLTDDEEKEVYSKEATRRNESYEDRLTMYKDSITFWKLLQDKLNNFPCKISIYQATNGLRFRTVLNALYTSASSSDRSFSPSYLKKDEIVEFANELGWDDYLIFKEFIEFFLEVYGRIESGNIYIKSQFFQPIFDIYVKNRHFLKKSWFKDSFKNTVGRSDLLHYSNWTNKEAQVKIRELMLNYVNYKHSSNKFI